MNSPWEAIEKVLHQHGWSWKRIRNLWKFQIGEGLPPVEIGIDSDWVFVRVYLGPRQGVDSFSLLQWNFEQPFLKYGLLKDSHLGILGEVPLSSVHRIPEVVDVLSGTLQSEDPTAGGIWESRLEGDSAETQRVLKGACQEQGWQLLQEDEGVWSVKGDQEKVWIHFQGSHIIFLLDFFGLKGMSDVVKEALCLWLLKLNASVYYCKLGLKDQKAYLLVRLPQRRLTVEESQEAVRALHATFREFHHEAKALRDENVARTYQKMLKKRRR